MNIEWKPSTRDKERGWGEQEGVGSTQASGTASALLPEGAAIAGTDRFICRGISSSSSWQLLGERKRWQVKIHADRDYRWCAKGYATEGPVVNENKEGQWAEPEQWDGWAEAPAKTGENSRNERMGRLARVPLEPWWAWGGLELRKWGNLECGLLNAMYSPTDTGRPRERQSQWRENRVQDHPCTPASVS